MVEVLTGYLSNDNLPHALSFIGPSGCGKTTITRILANKLGCSPLAYKEHDAGLKGGVETIRRIKDNLNAVPSEGLVKVYVIDEAHELTRAAQEALLKSSEECPEHAYLFLCTTDPRALIHTVQTRFTPIQINPISPDDLVDLTKDIAKKEGKKLDQEVATRIADVSDGSARQALNILGKVLNIKDKGRQLDLIQKSGVKRNSWQLVQLLMGWGQSKTKVTWQQIKEIVQGLEGQEEAEKIRRTILSCLAKVCLSGGKPAKRAAAMFEAFRDDYYTTGFAGLVFSCFSACYGD